ncbi:hypothetical protein [Salinibacter phage 6_8]
MADLFSDQARTRTDAGQGQKVVYEDDPTPTLPDGRYDGEGDLSRQALREQGWGALNRRRKVLLLLYREGALTQQQAYEEIGTTRLAARIHELREAEDAPPIEKQMVTVEARDGAASVAEYYIPKVNE